MEKMNMFNADEANLNFLHELLTSHGNIYLFIKNQNYEHFTYQLISV